MAQTRPAGGPARYLGIIGYPVGHSISPAMHNEAFHSQGMNCHYGAFAVRPEELKAALDGVRGLGFLGLNVTIPHKEAVMEHLDEVAPMAAQVGAVNTIVNRGGRLIGYNTDGWGFIASLEEAGVKPDSMRAVVLGAGGAARAVALHLAWANVVSLTVSNRNAARAEALTRDVAAAAPNITVLSAEAFSSEERSALIDADLVVNCTPLGMQGDNLGLTPIADINLLPQHAVVYDTVYRPAETRLLHDARIRGLRTVGGLGMLVHQGACAWEYWFGRRGPVTAMYAAARAVLKAPAPASAPMGK